MIQQTIQEVKFQDIILSKKQRQARKTGKLRHWLEYLNMLGENKSFQKKNQAIKQMHKMFILHEDFWLKEVLRLLSDSANLTIESFQFAFLALEDGFYGKVAQVISQKLFEAYNCQKLRVNFVIAKLQILIAQFDHQGNSCSKIFDILIEIYFKTNNTKKVRQLFRRKLELGFDDYDITYDKYNTWENMQKDHGQSVNTTQLLQKARTQWSNHQIFLQEQLLKLQTQGQLQIRAQILDNKRRIKHCLIYLQNMNTARLHQYKYLQLLELLNNPTQKLWYLRRQALSQTHQLLQSYLECLEISGAQDQDIIAAYRLGLGLEDGVKHEMRYLEYLIRRINKHLSKKQDEEYNEKWGTNVEFFRNQVSELISKQRTNLNEQKTLVTKYYYLWIQVQTVIVKDSPTVQQIYDGLLAWGATEQIYLNYAKSMIQLNDLPKARFIFSKTCQTYNYSQPIVQDYRKFLQTYGSIEQVTKLKTKLKSLGKTEIQMQKTKTKQNIVVVKNDNAQSIDKFIRHVNSQVPQGIEKVEQKRIVSQVQAQVNKQVKQVQPQKPTQQSQQNLFKRCGPVQSKHQQPQNHPPKKKPHLDQQNTLFSKNLKPKWTEADLMLNIVFKENVQQVRIVQKENRKFCYIEFDSQENAQKEINSNKSCLQLAFSRPPSKSDNFTLFLCNLPTDTSKTAIKELIPQNYRAFIKDIRSKDKNDKKTAYVQFDDEQTRNQALAELKKQKITIGDRTIIAMSCQSDHQNKQKKNRTIFLKNLSFKCRQKDIRKFFQEKNCQSITEVFIPKDEKTNRPKGFAYVQFDNHDEVQKIIELQKAKLFDREFTIHRSDRCITHQEPHENKQSEKTNKPKEASKKSNNFFSNIFS